MSEDVDDLIRELAIEELKEDEKPKPEKSKEELADDIEDEAFDNQFNTKDFKETKHARYGLDNPEEKDG